MFRVFIAPLRIQAHRCGQLSCTWSRRIYYKQHCRKLHQTCCQFSPKGDKTFTHTLSKTKDRQKAGTLDNGFVPVKLFKPRPLDSDKQEYDRWQDDLDKDDTFGSVVKSPEFQDRTRHDKAGRRDFDRQHLKQNMRQETNYQYNTQDFSSRKWSRDKERDGPANFEGKSHDRRTNYQYNTPDFSSRKWSRDKERDGSSNFEGKSHDRRTNYQYNTQDFSSRKWSRDKERDGPSNFEGKSHDRRTNYQYNTPDFSSRKWSRDKERYGPSNFEGKSHDRRTNYQYNTPDFSSRKWSRDKERDGPSNFEGKSHDRRTNYQYNTPDFSSRKWSRDKERDGPSNFEGKSHDSRTNYQYNTPDFSSRKWSKDHLRDAQSNFAEKSEDHRSWDRPHNRSKYTERKGPRNDRETSPISSENNDSYNRYDKHSKYNNERQGMKRDEQSTSKQAEELSDTFGLLSAEENNPDLKHDDKFEEELLQDELEEKPHIPLSSYNRKHTAAWYSRRIMKLGKQGKVREAIDVFDRWMIKEDRVKPTAFEFSVLIHVLGQVGYTRKAFQLYNQMIRMGIKDVYSPHLFTSLFNACANSPWPDDGLERSRKLRTRMLVKGLNPNYIIYNAMIKSFGMCGDIDTAFALADEASHFYKADNNLLGSLLVACITDKESGFRHAIMVWRKMRTMGIEPELKDYCLLLRAVNECGIGSPELAKDLLTSEELPRAQLEEHSDREIDKRNMKAKKNKARKLKMFQEIDTALSKYVAEDNGVDATETDRGAGKVNNFEDNVEDKLTDLEVQEEKCHDTESAETTPSSKEWWQMDVFHKNSDETDAVGSAQDMNPVVNVLDPSSHFPQGLPLKDIKDGESRLAVIGGYWRLLRAMEKRNIKPNIVLFTQLMLSTPADCEEFLLDEMDMANVKPDITFYNLLVRKRACRNDYEGAKKLVKMMEEHDLEPDIKTYGILALTCTSSAHGYQLLERMEAANVQPNTEIMTALIGRNTSFQFNIHILRTMERTGIQPQQRFLETVEKKISFARKSLAHKEKNAEPGQDFKGFEEGLQRYIDYYDAWTRRMELDKPSHPWQPFEEKKGQP